MSFFNSEEARKKIVSLAEAAEHVSQLRKENPGIRIGVTTGAFAVPHRGHFNSFKLAREHCDVLIVTLASNDSLAKGGRMNPLVKSTEFRAEKLARGGGNAVDFVVCRDERDAVNLLTAIKPDFFFKGNESQYQRMDHPEQLTVLSYGGQVILTGSAELEPTKLSSRGLVRKSLLLKEQREAKKRLSENGRG